MLIITEYEIIDYKYQIWITDLQLRARKYTALKNFIITQIENKQKIRVLLMNVSESNLIILKDPFYF